MTTPINGFWFRTELAKICPDDQIDRDNDGQVVIYTNLTENELGNYVPFEDEGEAK